ncbi:aspartate aminotransferase family protein [Neorhizobium galegae]|uniref:aspartate aminotransferase family protein n=1 Tax=Neorhizobium galegae TaxID=399 RepID=UPI00127D0D4F|nr:aspartate aminotransferase family protein [Neorhizobium galegae]KAA9382363.1 aspartate aminotransferase family protein [Neorhizobium galegae]KAB1109670.1 aspartate aminotransferase family protein [Neorhizobium galegae]MCM2501651.1 aspartate aminotransferase family protein [Neorhizobium galegae]MCQ1775333.1 aspartate aminotransferase family protein [Neorhizobium galegae]MCQ1855666.1 aspartate aminotransferase family protein [Neorhizobium galegae]
MSNNQSLLARRKAAVPAGAASAYTIFAARAEGSQVWDADGKQYIDFAAGIAVMNVGHHHPKVTAAVTQQLGHYAHVAYPVQAYEPYIAVCERLNEAAPIADATSVLFTTGAEATENAVKIARIATGRPGIIAFTGSFHGRTNLALSLTGKVAPLRANYPHFQPGVFHVPFPVPAHGMSEEDSLKALDYLFKSSISPEQVAGIIIEPVQGEGGYYQAPVAFVRRLREICDQHGILLIADEIQSGFARTGRFFAIEHAEVEPDLIAVGKAIGGGLPLAGLIGKRSIMDTTQPGSLGGTYAGNPLSCAAALAVFDLIEEENLLQRSVSVGDKLKIELEKFAARNDVVPVGAIRGVGSMVAFEIFKDDGETPDPDATKALANRAVAEGLLVLPCGFWGNTIRIAPALTITDEDLEEGVARLARALLSDSVSK